MKKIVKPDFLVVGKYIKVAGIIGVIDFVAEKNSEITVKVISPKAASRMQPNDCDWLVYSDAPELWETATKSDFTEAAQRELDRVKLHFKTCMDNTNQVLAAHG